MKRIGMLYLGRKGSATVENLEICKTLAANNYIYIIISKYIENIDKYYELQSLYPNNIELFTINTYKSKIGFLFKSLNIFRFILIAIKIRTKHLDFIYQQMITYWGAILSVFLRNQKIVTAVHDPEMHVGEKDFLFECLMKINIQRSNKLVVFSKKFVEIVSEKYSVPVDKICCLKLGGYSYYNHSNSIECKENTKYNKILFFGRISEYKGIYVLLEAIELLKCNNFPITVRIVGNGSLSDKEKQLINHLGNSVELINRWINDDEVECFFEGIDFVVLPYIEATQSGVVMLSYAMHKAVLATNVGALDEQILNDTGIIVEPNNVKELANGIKKMYENNCYRDMGEKAFYYATEEWTWPKQANKLLDFVK